MKRFLNSGKASVLLFSLIPTVNGITAKVRSYTDQDGKLDYLELSLVLAYAVGKILPLLGINDATVAQYLTIVKTGYASLTTKVDEVQSHLNEVDNELAETYKRYI